MIDYQIQPNGRRCSATQRELQPGEKVFSALLLHQGKFVRQDFSAEGWQGPPAGAFGFWVGKVAAAESKRRPPINDELLNDFFLQLEGQNESARLNLRYVIALLLMRRRRFRFEETAKENDREVLVVRCVRTGATYRVLNPGLAEDELETVQDEVFKALGWA